MAREENVFGKVLNGKRCKVVFTNEAMWGCADWDIIPDVAADLIPEAADYVLKKGEGERFTIVSEFLRTVVSGFVTYKDDEEMELLVTEIFGDVYIVKHEYFSVD